MGEAINSGDTAWILVSCALVLMMTPALGFFYGGLVREKNALNTLMMSFTSLGFVGLAWALVGYSIAFAPGSAVAGGFGYVAVAEFVDTLDMFPTDPVGAHRIFRRRALPARSCGQSDGSGRRNGDRPVCRPHPIALGAGRAPLPLSA